VSDTCLRLRRGNGWSAHRSAKDDEHSSVLRPARRSLRHGDGAVSCQFWFLLARGEDYAQQQPSLTAKRSDCSRSAPALQH